jgi:putative transposase
VRPRRGRRGRLAFNSLFPAELVYHRRPWRSSDDLDVAVAEYID